MLHSTYKISHLPQFFTEAHQGIEAQDDGFIRCFVPPLFLKKENDHLASLTDLTPLWPQKVIKEIG
jgi:hypothetical protein